MIVMFRLPDSLVMEQDGLIAELVINTFFEIIGGTLEEIFKKNENAHERYMVKKDEKQQKNEYTELQLDHLIAIKKLGQG